MPDHLGDDMRKSKEEKEEKDIKGNTKNNLLVFINNRLTVCFFSFGRRRHCIVEDLRKFCGFCF